MPSTTVPTERESTVRAAIHDIGIAVGEGSRQLSERERLFVLEQPWVPPPNFQFPHTERKDGDKVRKKYLGPQHFLKQYSVFAYSESKKGVFCRPCSLFAPTEI